MIVAIVALLVITTGTVLVLRAGRGPVAQAVPFSDLLHQLDRGAVAAVVVNGDALDFTLRTGELFRTTAPANYVTANAAFVPDLAKRNVRIDVRSLPEPGAYSYGALLMGLGFVAVLAFTMYRVTSGRIPALESKARRSCRRSAPTRCGCRCARCASRAPARMPHWPSRSWLARRCGTARRSSA